MNVEIIGKFFDNHSLSIINRYLAVELLNLGVNITISPIDSPDPVYKINKETLRTLMSMANKDIGKIDVQLRHSYPPMWRWPVSADTKIIYVQPWEFSKVPSEWQYKFETFADHLIVLSNWTRNVFLDAGINPNKISSIPVGYNTDIFNTVDRKPDPKFTFTFVGCPQHRKGLDILINAFSSSFVRADAVKLVIKDTPAIYGENGLISEILRLQYHTGCAEITVIDDMYSEEEMASLYKSTSVLVHPYRGEGFGMHIQEAMACGAFPLVTGGGATDDFVNENCGLRINSRKRLADLTSTKVFATKPGDSLSNMGSHGWLIEPEEQDLINKMRFLYHHHERNVILDKVNNADTLHSWSRVASKYLDVITEVSKKTPIR